jgi:hypothetical protein
MKKFFAIFAAVCLFAAANVFAANLSSQGTETVKCSVVPAINVTAHGDFWIGPVGAGDSFTPSSKFIQFDVTGGPQMTYNIAMSGPDMTGSTSGGTAPIISFTDAPLPTGTSLISGSEAWAGGSNFELATNAAATGFNLQWVISNVDASLATAGEYHYAYTVTVNYVY